MVRTGRRLGNQFPYPITHNCAHLVKDVLRFFGYKEASASSETCVSCAWCCLFPSCGVTTPKEVFNLAKRISEEQLNTRDFLRI